MRSFQQELPPNSEPCICSSTPQMDSLERKAIVSPCVSVAWAWEGVEGKGQSWTPVLAGVLTLGSRTRAGPPGAHMELEISQHWH